MKIVMTYQVGDGFNYACTVVDCIEHDSVEKALHEFASLCRSNQVFKFHKMEHHQRNFIICGKEYFPQFEEFSEWFERKNRDKTIST